MSHEKCDRVAIFRISKKAIIPCFAVGVAILAGYQFGRTLSFRHIGTTIALALFFGIGFQVTGAYKIFNEKNYSSYLFFLAIGEIVYTFALIVWQPFLLVYDRRICFSVLALVPFVAGGVIFSRFCYWLPATGLWLVFFAGVLALSYNVNSLHSGVGFFCGWAD